MQQKRANESHFTVFQSCLNIYWLKIYLQLLCVNVQKNSKNPNKQTKNEQKQRKFNRKALFSKL